MNTLINRHSGRRPRPGWLLAGYALALALLSVGCAALPQPVAVDFPEAKPVAPLANTASLASAERAASGSLFNKVSYRPTFEDPRARAVGDSVTIQIAERVTASQSSKSSANRTTTSDASVSAFPFVGKSKLPKLKIGAASENDFSGEGDTESDNTFFGSITTTVVEVLPNGHLVVAGEKQIGVNQNVDVLRFSGTIDPRLVQPGNIVNSTQVANARLESRGRGAQAEAQTVGWLMRFFFSFLPL